MPDRTRARELASEYAGTRDPLGWFEALYAEAEQGRSVIPWDDRLANSQLIDYWRAHPIGAQGKSAVVVGCGLGEDAEEVAAWGFRTTAFDISPTAIKAAQSRFPGSAVRYETADLFRAPSHWRHAFDFVFETNTLQALPAKLRPEAIEQVASFVKSGGLLLVIARGREEFDPEGELPWPLTRAELVGFERAGLTRQSFEDLLEGEPPRTRRFRIAYTRDS
jgi:SAM-dependent methyltransferase